MDIYFYYYFQDLPRKNLTLMHIGTFANQERKR